MRAALTVVLLVALPVGASAQDTRLQWSDDWARVHPVSYVAAPTLGVGSFLFGLLYEPDDEARVTGPFLFDAEVRTRLAASSETGRETAAALSDVLLGALVLWPFVDSIGVVGLGDENSDVFLQLSLIAVEAMAADYFLSTAIKLLVHRERPHADRCSVADRAAHPERCGTRGRTRSFYSGHASAAFNAAGVVCLSHGFLPLYDSPAADSFACGVALAAASIVGVLRVVADRHHASDVLAGAVMGLATGLLMPWLLHYGLDPEPDEPGRRTDGIRVMHIPLAGGRF
ncbi:MAG: phosphatase PAP2 family protein [Sandaracinaceae bacterium]